MEILPRPVDSNSSCKNPSRFKDFFQKIILISPLLACGLFAGLYLLEWAWSIGTFSSLVKKRQLSVSQDCSVPFWDAFLQTVGQVSTSLSVDSLPNLIPLELSSGTLSIIALLELMGIVLQVGFIIGPVYQSISYVFVILAGGFNNSKRKFVSKIFQHTIFRAFLLLPGSFSNFAIGTWLQINTVDSLSCLSSDLKQSPIDASLVWMYFFNSFFRAIIAIYMLIGFLLGPIFGIRKPFIPSAEEMEEFLAFYREKLAGELVANQNLKIITFRTAVFDFILTYQKNFMIKFHSSGKIVVVNLLDIISNNMSFATLQAEIESQYRKEQSTETKTHRRLALAYLIFQSCIIGFGLASGGYLFIITLIYHKKPIKILSLALALLIPALLNLFLAMSRAKGKNGNRTVSDLNKVTPLGRKNANKHDIVKLEIDDFSSGSKEKGRVFQSSEAEILMQEKYGLISSGRSQLSHMEPSIALIHNDLIPALHLFYKTELTIPVDKVSSLQKATDVPSKSQLSQSKRKVTNSAKRFFEKSDAISAFEPFDLKTTLNKEHLSHDPPKARKRTPKLYSDRLRSHHEVSVSSESNVSKTEEPDNNFGMESKVRFAQNQLSLKNKPRKVKVVPRRI